MNENLPLFITVLVSTVLSVDDNQRRDSLVANHILYLVEVNCMWGGG